MNTELFRTKRYPKEMRKAVRSRILELWRDGKNSFQIATHLESEGIRTPDGKTPGAAFVRNQIFRMRSLGKLTRKYNRRSRFLPQSTTRTTAQIPTANQKTDIERLMLEILTNPALKDDRRVKILTQLVS